jgi:hypothetical protein
MIADYKILGTTYFWKALYIPKMGWYPARVHPFCSGNGKRDVHIIYCVVPTLLYFTYFSASGKNLCAAIAYSKGNGSLENARA